ncbi:hypothetical protein LN042_22955 [Kitasatospora sp. RB6PN24]|uniref:hypothetical protein n=1 Tax=Kitasatospora humi TaxID=2893891 RepID=UPI001E2DF018|nr:hypothetical protein [Kitasatospora humi]MCC9309895.1 hypothetical protein [Kitasatospora humi]
MAPEIQAAGGISVQPAVPLSAFTGSSIGESEHFRLLTLPGPDRERHVVAGVQATERAVGAPAFVEELAEFFEICRQARPGAAFHSSMVAAALDGTDPARVAVTRTGFTWEPDERTVAKAAAGVPDGDDPEQPYIPMPIPAALAEQAGPDGRIPLWCTVQAPSPKGRWQVVLNGTIVQNLHDAALRAAAEHGHSRVIVDMSKEVLATYRQPEPAVTALEAIAAAQRRTDRWVALTEVDEPSADQREALTEGFRLAERAAEYAERAVAAVDPVPADVRRAWQSADFLTHLYG